MTDETIDDLLKGVDVNNDGAIDYKEFIMMMQSANTQNTPTDHPQSEAE
jgi:Ca2+-binding EF-hand superfamily protein